MYNWADIADNALNLACGLSLGDWMGDLQVLSVLLDVAIVALCVGGMFWKKMKYLAGLAAAFAVYALIDVSRLYSLVISDVILDSMHLLATFCVLVVVWQFYSGMVKPEDEAHSARKK